MPIVFYQHPASDPCRAVELTARDLGVELIKKSLDMEEKEHLKPEFLQINPQHTVPTIDDDGFCLWDSHAIMTYLVDQYGKDSPLYPKDPKKRAVVDRMLYFDIGTLYRAQREFLIHQVFLGLPPDPEKEEALKKALGLLDQFLENTPYVAGNNITVADYSILCTLAYLEEVGGYCVSAYPRVSGWMQRMKGEIPNYKEINEIPLRKYKEELKDRIATFKPCS